MSDPDRCSISLHSRSLSRFSPPPSISTVTSSMFHAPHCLRRKPLPSSRTQLWQPYLENLRLGRRQAFGPERIDIIAIDFSEKLPFRLKQTKVKLLLSVEFILRLCIQMLSRMSKQGRQMITNAKVRIAKY
ncbi:hypothetical protein CFP56_038295 [Quercus suber]|uniref:Uncharacterized protein n=1 Tax=Quercus suber TaxID=58331 RepID=A0AAW0LPH9_QUESU